MEISQSRQKSRDNLDQSWLPYHRLLKFISKLTHIPSDILNTYARTLSFLLLLGLIFPFNLLITLCTYILSSLFNLFQQKTSLSISNPNSKRILISGGRMTSALQLCRSFSQAGHQIILIDESPNWLTGHRFSNSVERFYVHPSALEQPDLYINTLANIVRKEKINLFISLLPSQIDLQVKSALEKYNCSVFDEINLIENKYSFINQAHSFNLTVPKTILLTSRQELLDYNFDQENCLFICKSLISNYSVRLPQVTRVETIEYINKLIINEDFPYILQEFISGKEYSTYGVCKNGELTLFTCTQSKYKHIEHPEILQWCSKYIQALKLTGQFSIDFIVNENDGKPYAIRCNSSGTSALTQFYNHPNLIDAYLSDGIFVNSSSVINSSRNLLVPI